eukprot:s8_g4.t1
MPTGELRVALRVPTVLAVPRNVSQAWLRARRNQGDQPDQQLVQPALKPNRDEDVAVAVPSVPRPGTSPGLMRVPGLPLGMEPTRHCPSCESGMVAPGVRHSAECRRKQAEFRDLEQQIVAPEGELEDAPYSPSLGPEEPADEPADVNMEVLPEASSAPAEAAPSAAPEQKLHRKMLLWTLKQLTIESQWRYP